MKLSARRFSVAIAALGASCVAIAPTAAGASAPNPNPCGYTPAKVFAPWHDNRGYVLTPDGGFENGAAGWTLENGAAVGEGNETFQVGGAADHQSLALPAGSSATSPAVCVTKHTGVFRLFARNTPVTQDTTTHGNKQPQLQVEVLYTGKHGNHRSLRVGSLRAGDAWAPTRKLPIVLGQAKGKGKLQKATVQLRFTPVGAPADWQIDDVYLDPRLRR
jgi:hypothetical protein